MVVLREGMCPGLDGDLLRDLRRANIRTGPSSVSRSYINYIYIIFLKAEHQKRLFLRSSVEDLVSSNIEELAQKCSISYKVGLLYLSFYRSKHKKTYCNLINCCWRQSSPQLKMKLIVSMWESHFIQCLKSQIKSHWVLTGSLPWITWT